jgi:hypothetical protein
MPNERQLLQNAPGILSAILSPTPLGIGALAANVGASFLAERDQDKARKKAQAQQDQNVAMANLINSFGGRATPSPVQQKQGIGAPARLLSAIGQALPVIAGLQDQGQARELRDVQLENARRAGAMARGMDSVLSGINAGGSPPSTGSVTTGDQGNLPSFAEMNPDASLPDFQSNLTMPETVSTAPAASPTPIVSEEPGFATGRAKGLQFLKQLEFLDGQVEALSTKGLFDPAKRADLEQKLGGRYFGHVKGFQKAQGFFGQLVSMVKQGKDKDGNPLGTPAGDLSLIFNFMKVLDSDSAVKEGEQASAANAGGVDERIRDIYNLTLKGNRLTPPQRQDFVTTAARTFMSQMDIMDGINQQFTGMADRYGLDPRNIIVNTVPQQLMIDAEAMLRGL